MPSRNLNMPLDRFLLEIQSENKPSFHVKMCGEGTNVSMKMGMCVMSFSLFSPDVPENVSSCCCCRDGGAAQVLDGSAGDGQKQTVVFCHSKVKLYARRQHSSTVSSFMTRK